MRQAICRNCGAKTGIRRWFREGWLRAVVTYHCGGQRTFYTCKVCRGADSSQSEATKPAEAQPHTADIQEAGR